MAARSAVGPLAYYASAWNEFADSDGEITGSCYGRSIFSVDTSGTSQWQRVKELLQQDPDSRRAVLHLGDPATSGGPEVADVACANSLQLLVRGGHLNAVVYMRSNDAYLGLPYDVFVFTMLQEFFACELGLLPGSYRHVASSMHLYDRHLDRILRFLGEPEANGRPMRPMGDVLDIPCFLQVEEAIRAGGSLDAILGDLGPYWRDLAEVLKQYSAVKNRGRAVSAVASTV